MTAAAQSRTGSICSTCDIERGVGPARWRNWAKSGRVFPLISLIGLQAAFALTPEQRRNEVLHFEVMRRACPELARMRFANASWPEALLSNRDDADDFRAPPYIYTGPAPVQWQAIRLEQNRAVLEAVLLDDSANPVFEILDRKQLVRTLRESLPREQRAQSAVRSAHGRCVAPAERAARSSRR